jgi:hypothetical protein
MIVKKLYIVNNGDDDLDVLLVSCLLNPMDYSVVGGWCNGDEFKDVGAAYHEECIDGVEVEVDGRPLGRVLNDLYNVYLTGRVDMKSLMFIAETERGGYIQFGFKEVKEIEEEDDEEGI